MIDPLENYLFSDAFEECFQEYFWYRKYRNSTVTQ